jgi:hypothetical protein
MKYEINSKNTPLITVEARCIQFLTKESIAGHVSCLDDGIIRIFFTERIDIVFRKNGYPDTVWVNGILPESKEYTIIYEREKVDSVQ